MQKVLVTGGSGFVGWNLCNYLLHEGLHVYATNNGCGNVPDKRIKIINKNYSGLNLKNYKFDCVYHTSAINDTQTDDFDSLTDVNVNDTSYIFEKCYENGCRKFIYSSSTAVYGNSRVPYVEDSTQLDPLTFYALSKVNMEEYAKGFSEKYKDALVVGLRYCNVYGFGEFHKGKRASMIHQFLMDKILKRTSKVFTDGNQKREWVHVDDVAEANYLASKSSQNSIYNVGSGDCISFNDLVDLIRLDCFEYVDCPFSKTYQNYTKSNIDKIKKELGYNTKRTLESNLLNLEIKLRSHFNV
jgi:nucleoside-diphosphate-sugar epimerase